jgi:deazaflavin-dependent oxidoreductase (nitroreductase family)
MTAAASDVAANRARPPKALASLSRVFNPLVLALAGTRLMPLYGVIYHRGRRSGKVYRTPVVVRPTADGFVIPMPWGEGTDWLRNVRAAGGCDIRWKSRMYPVDSPEVMDLEAARNEFSGVQQKAMTWFGIRQAVKMHFRR